MEQLTASFSGRTSQLRRGSVRMRWQTAAALLLLSERQGDKAASERSMGWSAHLVGS